MSKNPQDDEVAFVAGLTNSEVTRIRALVGPCSASAEPAELLRAQERLVDEMGRISARLLVIEQAIEKQLLTNTPAVDPTASRLDTEARSRSEISVDELYDWRTFHDVEVDSKGRRFAWTTGRGFSAHLVPEGDAPCPYLQVFFVAIVRPSYAKRAEMVVNGEPLRHVVIATDGELCLEAKLPRSMLDKAVDFELRLPATHSLAPPDEPREDWRDGGIAVTRIALSPKSRASRMKRLIR